MNELVVQSEFLHGLSAAAGLPSTMALLPAPLDRHRALSATAAGALALVALTAGLAATAEHREQRWTAACVAAGGRVETVEPVLGNPLVLQSDDPVLRCLGPDGVVRATR